MDEGTFLCFILFIFFPTPAVAESSVYFQQTSRDNYFTDNIQNITTLYFILFTLRVQYCAWGTPSALSYYYNNNFTIDSTFHIIHITNTTLTVKYTGTVRFRVS